MRNEPSEFRLTIHMWMILPTHQRGLVFGFCGSDETAFSISGRSWVTLSRTSAVTVFPSHIIGEALNCTTDVVDGQMPCLLIPISMFF